MKQKTEFKLVDDLSELPTEITLSLKQIFSGLRKEGVKAKAVLGNNSIIGLVIYKPEKTNARIEFLWTKSAYPEFSRQFKTTPADYLLEELFRTQKIDLFRFEYLRKPSLKMFERKKKQGLWFLGINSSIGLTEKAKKQATERKQMQRFDRTKDFVSFSSNPEPLGIKIPLRKRIKEWAKDPLGIKYRRMLRRRQQEIGFKPK